MNFCSSCKYLKCVSCLCFFMVFNKLFGGHAMQVTQLGLHHDWQLTQGLFDDAFGNSVD